MRSSIPRKCSHISAISLVPNVAISLSMIPILPIRTKVFNSSVEQNEFPNELKLAGVLPTYKKRFFVEGF